MKSLQKEQNSTNLLLWPPICRNKPAITPKWLNSLDTNSNSPAFSLVFIKFLLNYFDRLWHSLLLFTRTALGPDGRASAVLLQLLRELPDKNLFIKDNYHILKAKFSLETNFFKWKSSYIWFSSNLMNLLN